MRILRPKKKTQVKRKVKKKVPVVEILKASKMKITIRLTSKEKAKKTNRARTMTNSPSIRVGVAMMKITIVAYKIKYKVEKLLSQIRCKTKTS